MEKIGDIIGRIVPDLKKKRMTGKMAVSSAGGGSRIAGDIESVWCRVVDENLRAHSYVEFIRNRTIFVKVDSSCYLSALKMKNRDIVAGLKDAGINVRSIRFRM